jgi:uncharacterized protein (UPF0332 family)
MRGPERIEQAHSDVEEAMLLMRENIGTKPALAKLYHGMMQCLFAIFDVRDMGPLTHVDIIERLELEYVNAGRIDRSILNSLRRAYDLTHECDCDHMPVPTESEIVGAMQAAEELMRAAEQLLKTEARV